MSITSISTSLQGNHKTVLKVELHVFKLWHLPRTLLMTRLIINTGQKSIRFCTHARIREREPTFHWGSSSGLWRLAQMVSNWILGNTSAQSFLGQTMKPPNYSYHKTQWKGITMIIETSYWFSTTNKGKTLLLLKGLPVLVHHATLTLRDEESVPGRSAYRPYLRCHRQWFQSAKHSLKWFVLARSICST